MNEFIIILGISVFVVVNGQIFSSLIKQEKSNLAEIFLLIFLFMITIIPILAFGKTLITTNLIKTAGTEKLEQYAITADKMVFCLKENGLGQEGGEIDGVKYVWIKGRPVMTFQMTDVADGDAKKIRNSLVKDIRYNFPNSYLHDGIEWYADNKLTLPYDGGDVAYLTPSGKEIVKPVTVSSGGCSTGFAGMALLILAGLPLIKRKK